MTGSHHCRPTPSPPPAIVAVSVSHLPAIVAVSVSHHRVADTCARAGIPAGRSQGCQAAQSDRRARRARGRRLPHARQLGRRWQPRAHAADEALRLARGRGRLGAGAARRDERPTHQQGQGAACFSFSKPLALFEARTTALTHGIPYTATAIWLHRASRVSSIRGPQHARSRPSPLQRTLGRAHPRRQHPRGGRRARAAVCAIEPSRAASRRCELSRTTRCRTPTGSKRSRLERLWI